MFQLVDALAGENSPLERSLLGEQSVRAMILVEFSSAAFHLIAVLLVPTQAKPTCVGHPECFVGWNYRWLRADSRGLAVARVVGDAAGAVPRAGSTLSGFSRLSCLGPRPRAMRARESGSTLVCQPWSS